MSELTSLSKYLSYLLRHEPHAIGLQLDDGGWADLNELIAKATASGKPLTRELLLEIVATSDKQRFAISEDGLRIRANQGHSIEVELGYERRDPPPRLYHGTVAAALDAIRNEGLRKMQRHHVHLSSDVATATIVAKRRGKPVILTIAAAQMHADGYVFFRSANGVWLTDSVPRQYIEY